MSRKARVAMSSILSISIIAISLASTFALGQNYNAKLPSPVILLKKEEIPKNVTTDPEVARLAMKEIVRRYFEAYTQEFIQLNTLNSNPLSESILRLMLERVDRLKDYEVLENISSGEGNLIELKNFMDAQARLISRDWEHLKKLRLVDFAKKEDLNRLEESIVALSKKLDILDSKLKGKPPTGSATVKRPVHSAESTLNDAERLQQIERMQNKIKEIEQNNQKNEFIFIVSLIFITLFIFFRKAPSRQK